MRVSKTELSALIKQAYEGMGYDQGCYEHIASTLVWAAMHGYVDINRYLDKYLQQHVANAQSYVLPSYVLGTNKSLEIDFKSSESAIYGHLVAALASTLAAPAEITILSPSEPVLLLSQLSYRLQSQAIFACYRAKATDEPAKIYCSSDGEFSSYESASELPSDADVLFVQITSSEQSKPQWFVDVVDSGDTNNILDANQARANFRVNLEHNLQLNERHWQSLTQIACNVLVESNEQSRMGAGA